MNTKEKILDQALQMFNERGIEYVGLRELAAQLDMRVGNLTYYFPTKDDLVFALSQELTKANEAVFVAPDGLSMQAFLQLLYRVYQNQWRYRCLLLSFVHLTSQNQQIAEAYQQTQQKRGASLQRYLSVLEEGGFLKKGTSAQDGVLPGLLALVNRFWLSEAAISRRGQKPEEQMQYALNLVAGLLLPYTTEKGRRQVEEFRKGL
jgi:AcrR family transcriptional regulator